MIPWFERPVIYDVRARPHLVESTSGSRDLQMVSFSLYLFIFLLTTKHICMCLRMCKLMIPYMLQEDIIVAIFV